MPVNLSTLEIILRAPMAANSNKVFVFLKFYAEKYALSVAAVC